MHPRLASIRILCGRRIGRRGQKRGSRLHIVGQALGRLELSDCMDAFASEHFKEEWHVETVFGVAADRRSPAEAASQVGALEPWRA